MTAADRNGTTPRGFDLSDNVNHLLRRAHTRADAYFNETMADLELTARQAALLYAVDRCPGGSISSLSRVTGMDRGTLSEMIPRLVRRGLLSRKRDESDGRAQSLSLTEHGADVVRQVHERTRGLGEQVLATLPPEYRPLLLKMLALMVGIESETRHRVEGMEHVPVTGPK